MQQRSLVVLVFMLVAAGVHVACAQQGGTAGEAASEQVVARYGDRTITAAELEELSAPALASIRQQIYDTQTKVLNDEIYDRVLALAAAEAAVTPEEYTKAHVDDKLTEPADEDVARVMEQYRERLADEDDAARQQVISFLKNQQRRALQQRLREELFAQANVRILLDPPRVEAEISDEDPSRGPLDAPITLVEYTDFQCPFCARVQPTLDQLSARYPGLIRHVFKQLPLAMHQHARLAAQASLCAKDQQRFWELHDWLFDNQSGLSRDSILAAAKELGLDEAAFTSCIDDGTHAAQVEADVAEANSFGITGTPGFLINGRVLGGAQPFGEFAEVVEDELQRAGIPIPPPPSQEGEEAGEASEEAAAESAPSS